eukprot:1779132-Rhodomonas_salina.3
MKETWFPPLATGQSIPETLSHSVISTTGANPQGPDLWLGLGVPSAISAPGIARRSQTNRTVKRCVPTAYAPPSPILRTRNPIISWYQRTSAQPPDRDALGRGEKLKPSSSCSSSRCQLDYQLERQTILSLLPAVPIVRIPTPFSPSA